MLSEDILAALLVPAHDLVAPFIGLSAYYIFSNIIFVAIFFYAFRFRQQGWASHSFFDYIFPRQILLHPSAIFDLSYYIFIRSIKPLTFGAVFYVAGVFNKFFAEGMHLLFGAPGTMTMPLWLATLLKTVLLFLIFDFSYWLGHLALHKSRLLWEFHKGHHAAEVMPPFTVCRMHPLEEFESGIFIMTMTGLGTIMLDYMLGHSSEEFKLLHTNIIMFVFYITIFNLRHSHIWLPVTGLLGKIIHSPTHHQLHHSNHPQHYDKNLGFCLSIWDWMAGTLIVPGKEPVTQLGIGQESAAYNRFWAFLYLPFVNSFRLLFRRDSKDAGLSK